MDAFFSMQYAFLDAVSVPFFNKIMCISTWNILVVFCSVAFYP